MKNVLIFCTAVLSGSVAFAENLENTTDVLCAPGQAQVCVETGECFSATPWELNMPEFIVIDLKNEVMSTTRASGLNRASEFTRVAHAGGTIYLHGIEGERAFQFVIHEGTGKMTAAVSLDGISVTVFGSCTHANI